MSSNNKQIIPILDLFRLVAALLVALVHYEIIFGRFVMHGSFATTALSWFFVLSGFIIAYNYPSLEGAEAYRRYFLHRFIRIYPIYALSVVLAAALVGIGHGVMGDSIFAEIHRPYELGYDLPEDKSSGFWLMALFRYLTFTQSISSIETLKLVYNGPLWSLVLEVYFYLLFPLFLILLRPVNTMARIIAALVAGYLLQFALIQYFLPPAESYNVMNLNVPVYTNPLIRGIEFLFGMLLYKAFVLLPPPDPAHKANWVPVLAAALAYVLANHFGSLYVPYQYNMFFLAVPFVTLMVWTLARANWHPSPKLYRFCLWSGGMSYVLYCFHWPIMEYVQFFDLLPENLFFPLHLLLLVAVFGILCHCLYRFYETPVRKWLYRRLDQPGARQPIEKIGTEAVRLALKDEG